MASTTWWQGVMDGEQAMVTRPSHPPDGLTGDALLIVRACAVAGPAFDVGAVGRLLELPPRRVIEALQMAADAGLPVSDDGDGHMRLPDAVAEMLRRDLLPSLEAAWRERLTPVVAAPAPARAAVPERDERPQARPAEPPPEVEELLLAAREAAERGAFEDGLERIDEAREALSRLPESKERSHLLARMSLETARLQWRGDTLDRALATLEEIERAFDGEVPLAYEAEHATLMAAVLYEIGDPASLERALEKLATASRRLADGGEPVAAVRLLNEQAAIYVRLGDTVRAHHLLQQSHGAFAAHAGQSPTARLELAETEHLLARLALHVTARPGREDDAVEVALRHARAASETYRELAMERELARVEETIGRLELLRGSHERALPHLSAAAEIEERLGDLLGLARTAEAFSRAQAHAGKHGDALRLLAISAELNLQKGSTLGLTYNRESLEELVRHAQGAERQAILGKAQTLLARIDSGLARLGHGREPGR